MNSFLNTINNKFTGNNYTWIIKFFFFKFISKLIYMFFKINNKIFLSNFIRFRSSKKILKNLHFNWIYSSKLTSKWSNVNCAFIFILSQSNCVCSISYAAIENFSFSTRKRNGVIIYSRQFVTNLLHNNVPLDGSAELLLTKYFN